MASATSKVQIAWLRLLSIGVYVWMFVLPWQTRMIMHSRFMDGVFWEYASLSIYASEILLVLCVIGAIVYQLVYTQPSWRVWLREHIMAGLQRPMQISVMIILFCAWFFVSLFWSADSTISVIRGLHILILLGGVVVIRWLQIRPLIMMLVFIAGAGIQAGLGAVQFLQHEVVGMSWLGISYQGVMQYGSSVVLSGTVRWLRAYGGLPHPNILGGFLVIAIALMAYLFIRLYCRQRYMHLNTLYIYALMGVGALLFSGILLSFSRAAWLALVVMSLWWLVRTVQARQWHAVRAGGILALCWCATFLFWFWLFPQPFFTRLQASDTLEQQSLQERSLSYADNKSFVEKYGLSGAGFGAYTAVLGDAAPERPLSINQPVHNAWLLILSELGIVGVVLLFMIFWLVYKTAPDQTWSGMFLLGTAVLMCFDHWWVSLYIGNVLLIVVLTMQQFFPTED